MAPKEPKISKQTAAGITRHITFTIPKTLEIIRKPGSTTSQCHYGSIQNWIHGTKKYKEKITCKNLGQ
jgi:hypothetical protein